MNEPYPTITYGPDGLGLRFEWTNFVLLQALQASQGLIGTSVRGLAVEAGARKVTVHACLARRDESDLEDLRDLTSYLEDGLELCCRPVPEVALDLYFGETDPSWPGYRQHRLFSSVHRHGASCPPIR